MKKLKSSHFPKGTPTEEPIGFGDFCDRNEDQCLTKGDDIARLDKRKSKNSSENSETS